VPRALPPLAARSPQCAPRARPALRGAGLLPGPVGHSRWGAGPALHAKQKVDRDDPEYQAVLARQKVLTEAMDVLTAYDEAQADFTSKHADSNAPLGDWCGYYKRLTSDERAEMRSACRTLASEAAYVLIGLNAQDLGAARAALKQWLQVHICYCWRTATVSNRTWVKHIACR